MKRPFNFWDGFVLLLFFLKFTGMGPAFSWWECFIPWLVELVWQALGFCFKYSGIEGAIYKRILVVLYRWRIALMKWKIKKTL